MSKIPQKILVIRLSAIGDVAMTVPSVWSLTKNHPDVQVTFVSQGFARDIINQIPGVLFFEADTKKRHKGFWGIFKLYKEIRTLDEYDAVVDLHNVIRSKIIRTLFRLHGVRCAVINKGRNEKKKLTRVTNKQLVPLKSTFDRYADVFTSLGFTINDNFDYLFREVRLPDNVTNFLGYKKGAWVGIAPFAKHQGKIYPLEMMEAVVQKLSQQTNIKLVLIGGGGSEKDLLTKWAEKYPNTVCIARKFSILDELKIISNLDVMLCMDSANMHFASLVNTPVLSIWGATHPYTGFYGWRQNPKNAIQVDLYCRPCSVYGNKKCYRDDYACLTRISPQLVISSVNTFIDKYKRI